MRRLSTAVQTVTRCVWCQQPASQTDPLHPSPMLPGRYHGDCGSVAYAQTLCVCGREGGPWESELSGSPYGYCLSCGKYRCWVSPTELDSPDFPGEAVTRLLAGVPRGQRSPFVAARVQALWAQWRAQR